MKRGLIAVAAAALLLTGCTTQTPEAAVVSDVPAGTTAPTPQAATPTPTAAAPVEVTATTPPAKDPTDVLVGIQLTVADYDIVVNADQIKSAADYTCDQIAAGADERSIVALTGDIPTGANTDLVQMSADFYCPIR